MGHTGCLCDRSCPCSGIPFLKEFLFSSLKDSRLCAVSDYLPYPYYKLFCLTNQTNNFVNTKIWPFFEKTKQIIGKCKNLVSIYRILTEQNVVIVYINILAFNIFTQYKHRK